jgi:hypothetical protein
MTSALLSRSGKRGECHFGILWVRDIEVKADPSDGAEASCPPRFSGVSPALPPLFTSMSRTRIPCDA